MNKLICSVIVAGGAVLCVSAAPQRDDGAQLAKALTGYAQSGPPTDCVMQRDLGDNRSAGENAIIFYSRIGDRLWVNRPAGGCQDLNQGLALVTHTTSDQLCRGDIADVIDPVAHIHEGSCGLGDFTPYQRVRRH